MVKDSVEKLLRYKNIILVGESGCGKSEIAINMARLLNKAGKGQVHLFDMDQTKPLHRARDVREAIEGEGVYFHYEEQFFDAPVPAGGVAERLLDPESLVVMDVGGNQNGARLIGSYAHCTNSDDTICFFVINPYRPWSKDIESIDGTLSSILKSARINEFGIISNPNLGEGTQVTEVIEGNEKLLSMIKEFKLVDYICAPEDFADEVEARAGIPVIPLKLFLSHIYF